MHNRLNFLYDCNCEDCKTDKKSTVILAQEDNLKGVLKAVEKAFKKLHQNGKYSPEDLAKTKEYKNLINETSSVFETAITDNDMPEAMRKSLKEDVFLFSGLKTHAQLFEASRLLLNEDNQKKSFSQFSKDVSKIKENYNQTYLEAEWQFAVSSAQSAANWANISTDYDLQYRTANDEKVRATHAILHNITLPVDDVFWLYYYPPNGWRCRCLGIQIRKGKYEVSDSKKANANGEKATTQIGKDGKNKLAIFRFNPGMTKKVFPPEHPYAKVKGAKTVVKELQQPDNINLADFIKGDSPTNKEMKNILMKYAEISPGDFRRGLEDVKFLKSTSYMMQHAMYHNRNSGQWVGGSIITLSSHEFSSIKFNPLEEFRSGLAAIKSGKKLTFNQEYSFESLWHEILHAKTKTLPGKLSPIGVKNMETVNQFVARHTYPDFIKKLGGEAVHQKEILDNGYGYKSWVTDFRANLKNRKIDEKKAAKDLMPFLMENYSTIGSKVSDYLKENTK